MYLEFSLPDKQQFLQEMADENRVLAYELAKSIDYLGNETSYNYARRELVQFD